MKGQGSLIPASDQSGEREVMTRWGVGPRFAALSALYATAAASVQYSLFPGLRFVIISPAVNFWTGAALAAFGCGIYLVSAFTIDRYFCRGRLCTSGVYGLMRHPIYGAWISFIAPGIAIMTGSLVGLTVPLLMYLVFRRLIATEERYLEEKFGEVYHEYRHRVWAIFPRLWRVKP